VGLAKNLLNDTLIH